MREIIKNLDKIRGGQGLIREKIISIHFMITFVV